MNNEQPTPETDAACSIAATGIKHSNNFSETQTVPPMNLANDRNSTFSITTP